MKNVFVARHFVCNMLVTKRNFTFSNKHAPKSNKTFLENKIENGYNFPVMKLLLIVTLFLSFANCHSVVLALDDSHSVALEVEHGVDHITFFHAIDTEENTPTGIFSTDKNQEDHEFHLSTSTGLLQKKLQISVITKDNSRQNDHTAIPTNTFVASTTFEPDIAAVGPPVQVLRI